MQKCLSQPVLDNLEEYVRRVAEKLILPELVGVPPTVAAMACVYSIHKICEGGDSIYGVNTFAELLRGDNGDQRSN